MRTVIGILASMVLLSSCSSKGGDGDGKISACWAIVARYRAPDGTTSEVSHYSKSAVEAMAFAVSLSSANIKDISIGSYLLGCPG